MKRFAILSIGLFALAAESADAANFAVITSPPTILDVFVLLAAFGCIAGCFKVADLVRGGLLSKSWQLFMIGFALFALSQIASLCITFEIVALPEFINPALLVMAAGTFLYGLYETRRVLS